jgi:hypothetical protein
MLLQGTTQVREACVVLRVEDKVQGLGLGGQAVRLKSEVG